MPPEVDQATIDKARLLGNMIGDVVASRLVQNGTFDQLLGPIVNLLQHMANAPASQAPPVGQFIKNFLPQPERMVTVTIYDPEDEHATPEGYVVKQTTMAQLLAEIISNQNEMIDMAQSQRRRKSSRAK